MVRSPITNSFRLILVVILMSQLASHVLADKYHAYVGTYSGPNSKGIYLCEFDSEDGTLGSAKLVAEMKNASFVAIDPKGTHLYAVSETGDHKDGGQPSGAVHAFRIDRESGELVALNSVLSGGAAPCHIIVDNSGKFVLVANYTGGNASVFKINDDGTLGNRTSLIQHKGRSVNRQRQEAAHAHSINVDQQNRRVFVADLGLDQVRIYKFDATKGTLEPNAPPYVTLAPGSGPRHFSFHPNGKFAYVINEMLMTVTGFAYDSADGSLSTIQTISTLPDGVTDRAGMSTAEILVHPTGKFVYGSNRGHHSIVVYSVDASNGILTYVENEPTQGKTPRNFRIDPTGQFLLAENQETDSIAVFAIDAETGALNFTGKQIEIGNPVCIRFLKK